MQDEVRDALLATLANELNNNAWSFGAAEGVAEVVGANVQGDRLTVELTDGSVYELVAQERK